MDEIITFQRPKSDRVETFSMTREQLLWSWETGHLSERDCEWGLELARALEECILLKYKLPIYTDAILSSIGPEYHSTGNPWETTSLALYADYVRYKKMVSTW
jgi:hypothetical protein